MNLALTPAQFAALLVALIADAAVHLVQTGPLTGNLSYRGATIGYAYDGALQVTVAILDKHFPAILLTDDQIFAKITEKFNQYIAGGNTA